MRVGDLAQALAPGALLENRNPVDIERSPADVPPLQPGAAHSCPHSFDDEIAFEFCDSADDDHDGPPERAAGIKIFAEADELDLSSSSTSRKWRTDRAIRSEAQTRSTWKRPRRASRSRSSRPGRRAFVPEIRSVYSATI
jgi:hypothetical protein